jgi:hypothetical protein
MNRIAKPLIVTGLATVLIGCDGVVSGAIKAKQDGKIISNELMSAQYPGSFRPGNPPYLERDFEAGADFICDEIKSKKGRDFCADSDINWRK